MTDGRSCPRCQRHRLGYLRYCLRCGFDFDVPTPVAPAAPPAVAIEPVAPVPVALASIAPEPVAPRTARVYEPIPSDTVRPAAPSWRARGPRPHVGRLVAVATAALLGVGTLAVVAPSLLADGLPTVPGAGPAGPGATLPASGPSAGASVSEVALPIGATQEATVTRVVDGDTIRVLIEGVEVPVRYIGIDAPEPSTDDPAVKSLAEAASAANAELVDGREVILERDVSEVDAFDRLLRNVWVRNADGSYLLVNLELVRRGAASVTTYPPDVRYVEQLMAAQASAEGSKVGLWAPIERPSPTVPAVVVGGLIFIEDGVRERFTGSTGSTTWTSLAFLDDRLTLRWSVNAASTGDCEVTWRLEPTEGSPIAGTIPVGAGTSETGNRRYDTPFSDARLQVTSTCGSWEMSLEGSAQ